ncbi:MAG: phosphate ABC transporter substrate-binding protein [Pseudomonadota bacterium]
MSEPAPGRILIVGSSTMAPLVSAIALRYRARHPQVAVEVVGTGSARGLADTRAGKTDIGMVSRALSDADRDLYALPIGRDGVAVVLHKDNPVHTLSARQLVDIYTGKVVNWKQVGGRDRPIFTATAEPGRSSSELFVHFLGIRYEQMLSQRVVGDNKARIKLMLEHPDAIIYMSIGESERSALAGVPIKPLPIEGIEASSKNIRNGQFPIARPLTLVTRGAPGGLAKSFIEFATSSEATELIIAHDFVPYLD